MNAIDIVNQIKDETRNTVIVQWNRNGLLGSKTNGVTSECWATTVTDEPELYFEEQNKKFQNRATHCSKFPVSSFSEGVELYKELMKYFNNEEECPEPEEETKDSSKQLYLAIHIHYHVG